MMKELVILAEKDVGSAVFRLYSEEIYHVIVKKGERVTMDFIKLGYDFLDEQGGGRYYNIYEFSSFSEVDPEVREWMAKPPVRSYTYADALVISGLAQKMIANFYLRFNKPVNPTRIFTSSEDAYKWIKGLQDQVTK